MVLPTGEIHRGNHSSVAVRAINGGRAQRYRLSEKHVPSMHLRQYIRVEIRIEQIAKLVCK